MNTEKLFNALAELRDAVGDGPRERTLLDSLFRQVHSLKANALANGLNDLAAAAHEFENVLHAVRTGNQTPLSTAVPSDIWNSLKQEQKHTVQQTFAEGARLFIVQASFDKADFDQKFQSLKQTLSQAGEVISTSATIDSERSEKLKFRILYAQKDDALSKLPDVTVQEIALTSSLPAAGELQNYTSAIETAFQKLSTELARLPELPFGDVFEQAVRAGRSAASATGKEVEFEVRREGQELDKALADCISDALVHLVRNAVDHGIETSEERVELGKSALGKIVIEVERSQRQTRIRVTDDGRGIDPSLTQQIFRPGFSTASEVSETSGRGVGLDAVKTGIEEAGGSISVSSQPGHGSTFEIVLPS